MTAAAAVPLDARAQRSSVDLATSAPPYQATASRTPTLLTTCGVRPGRRHHYTLENFAARESQSVRNSDSLTTSPGTFWKTPAPTASCGEPAGLGMTWKCTW